MTHIQQFGDPDCLILHSSADANEITYLATIHRLLKNTYMYAATNLKINNVCLEI